jgi:uncharacterized protein with PIN domain
MSNKERIMLDTSAILALRSDEAGADVGDGLLRQAEKTGHSALVSFMTRMELLYIVWRNEDELAGTPGDRHG